MHKSHYTISANFYLYLYFKQKVFNISKISESQTDPKSQLVSIAEVELKRAGNLTKRRREKEEGF